MNRLYEAAHEVISRMHELRQNHLEKEYIVAHLTSLCEVKDAPELLQRAEAILGVGP